MKVADKDLLFDILNRAVGWRVTMLRLETSAPVAPDELERISEGVLAMADLDGESIAPDHGKDEQ